LDLARLISSSNQNDCGNARFLSLFLDALCLPQADKQTYFSSVIIIIIIIIIESGKEVKIQELIIEMQRMWNLKCTIIPVLIGANGIVMRSLRKNLKTVQGKHSIDSLQKTAILGTSHKIRKVLQCET
jgi:hypothetical protein